MYNAFVFKDDKNELGFGEQFCVEIEVEIDYSYPNYHDWESDVELIVNEYSVNYMSLKAKEPNKKLLQSFDSQEDFWETLTKEQQEKVYCWVGEKIKTQEIIDQLNEAAVDEYVDYQEKKAEGYYGNS